MMLGEKCEPKKIHSVSHSFNVHLCFNLFSRSEVNYVVFFSMAINGMRYDIKTHI